MRQLDDQNEYAGFAFEPGDRVRFELLGRDDVLDRDTDIITWTKKGFEDHVDGGIGLDGVKRKSILEVVGGWHQDPYKRFRKMCHALRICDTGSIEVRVIRVLDAYDDIPYQYEVEWLTPRPSRKDRKGKKG